MVISEYVSDKEIVITRGTWPQYEWDDMKWYEGALWWKRSLASNANEASTFFEAIFVC
jgi:hypothetical protein